MSWKSLFMRAILSLIMILFLLYWADLTIPMGALLIFLLVLSIGTTWAIVSILRDDELIDNLFDERKKRL